MKRKCFILMLAATFAGTMFTGCMKPKYEEESWPTGQTYALTSVPMITQAEQDAEAAGEKVPETTRGTEETGYGYGGADD